MKIRKVLVKYGDSVIPEGLRKIESNYIYIAEKGQELSKIGTALHILKRSLGEKECGEVFLAPDLAESCHEALLLRTKEDKSFIPGGITLFVLLSGPPIPES